MSEWLEVTLSLLEWIQIVERVEDDDFYSQDIIAQKAIRRIKEQLDWDEAKFTRIASDCLWAVSEFKPKGDKDDE